MLCFYPSTCDLVMGPELPFADQCTSGPVVLAQFVNARYQIWTVHHSNGTSAALIGIVSRGSWPFG